MKTFNFINLVPLFVCTILFGSCGRSGSSSTSASDLVVAENNTSMSAEGGTAMFDSETELSTGTQGFTVEQVYIIDGNDKKISNSEIALNSKVSIVYEGIKNYTLKNGKAFPLLSIQVIDNNQKTIISEADLMASHTDGLSEEDASVLRATITVGDPMKAGKYICSVQVVDKSNTNSTILSTWQFEVK